MLMIEMIVMFALGVSCVAFICLAAVAKRGAGLETTAADRLQPAGKAAPRLKSFNAYRSDQTGNRPNVTNAADGDGRGDQQRYLKAA